MYFLIHLTKLTEQLPHKSKLSHSPLPLTLKLIHLDFSFNDGSFSFFIFLHLSHFAILIRFHYIPSNHRVNQMLNIGCLTPLMLTLVFNLLNYNCMAKRIYKISSYYAIFEPAKEGGYNVSFPDFPGCVTFGKTFEESKEKAKEVLELWLEELASQKQKIPSKTVRPIIDEIKVALPC